MSWRGAGYEKEREEDREEEREEIVDGNGAAGETDRDLQAGETGAMFERILRKDYGQVPT